MPHYVGLDLGTTYTRIWKPDEGVILRCPSAAAIDRQTKRLVALGKDAREMLGKTPQNILACCPIHEGLVTEFDVASLMIHAMFVNRRLCSTFKRPVVLVGVPYYMDQVRQFGFENALIEAGARAVAKIPSVFAAAVGAGLRVRDNCGCMVLNIGGGLSESAAIALGDILAARSIMVGGVRFDAAIMNYLRQKRNLEVGAVTAEEVRIRIGVCDNSLDRGSMTVYGRSTRTGLASRQEVFSSEICEAITPAITAIANNALSLLEDVSPAISNDIRRYGIMLTGGCAAMPGMDLAIRRVTGLRVTVADYSRDCVINGLGSILKQPSLWGTALEYRIR